MSNQSWIVKFVIWLMVFLMSVGFAALVITPFMGSSSLFGGPGSGREATLELLEEAKADVEKDDCANREDPPTGAALERCKVAVEDLGSSYFTLSQPEPTNDPDVEVVQPKDAKQNLEKAEEAFVLLYQLDTKDRDSTQRLGAYYRDLGKFDKALPLWTKLVKAEPDNPDFLLQQGFAAQQAGEKDQALAAYRSFIKRFPERTSDVDVVKEQMKQITDPQPASTGLPVDIG